MARPLKMLSLSVDYRGMWILYKGTAEDELQGHHAFFALVQAQRSDINTKGLDISHCKDSVSDQ